MSDPRLWVVEPMSVHNKFVPGGGFSFDHKTAIFAYGHDKLPPFTHLQLVRARPCLREIPATLVFPDCSDNTIAVCVAPSGHEHQHVPAHITSGWYMYVTNNDMTAIMFYLRQNQKPRGDQNSHVIEEWLADRSDRVVDWPNNQEGEAP